MEGEESGRQAETTKAPETKGVDWPARIISILGLGISLLTAYFALVYTVDDLRLVANAEHVSKGTFSDGSAYPIRKYTFSFINLGTRAAVVTNAYSRDEILTDLTCGGSRTDLSMEPVVIKPGEIVTKNHLEISFRHIYRKPTDDSLMEVVPCIDFGIATPDYSVREQSVVLEKFEVTYRNPIPLVVESGRRPGSNAQIGNDPSGKYRPYSLIQRRCLFGSTSWGCW
jgi:hypothetical protein